ncbi:hypothetical protein BCM02_103278 [Paenibacillus methanolicus]|uniref:Uncharacterized protein n=1 Tax=Paenibacillus methanolicus TaxID=582686 RepID=A0A5S5CE75_9BACL|nr:hypothetical protein BCM02_103278 [Paenibacillus methanolicus]
MKMKSREHAFTIPVPYLVLRMGSGFLTSNFVQRIVGGHLSRHDNLDSESGRFGIALAMSILENRDTKQAIRQFIRELQHCRGTVLLDVRTQDGTELWVRL